MKKVIPIVIAIILIISGIAGYYYFVKEKEDEDDNDDESNNKEPDDKNKDMIIYEGQGIDSIKLGDNYDKIIIEYGSPDNELRTDKHIWLDYIKKNGIDILLNNETDEIVEIRFNPGYEGATSKGISLESDLEEVLDISGGATKTIIVNSTEESDGSLGSNRILYEIYHEGKLASYKFIDASNGILYWFYSNEDISQIVIIS